MTSRAELQEEIVKLESKVSLGRSAELLKSNKDFGLVTETYLKEYPIEIVNQLCMHARDSAEYVELVAELDAVSRFQLFLKSTIKEGQLAQQDLDSAKSIPDSELY